MDEERKSRRADETEEDGRDEAERKGGRNRERRGVRTEKLGRKVRAQDDGALARATDMRPSTSIEEGGRERGMGIQRIQWPYTSPPPAQPTLPSFVRSFVRFPRPVECSSYFRRPVSEGSNDSFRGIAAPILPSRSRIGTR